GSAMLQARIEPLQGDVTMMVERRSLRRGANQPRGGDRLSCQRIKQSRFADAGSADEHHHQQARIGFPMFDPVDETDNRYENGLRCGCGERTKTAAVDPTADRGGGFFESIKRVMNVSF